MPQIVDLDALVPEEIIFKYAGKEYRLPGDIDVETTFTIQQLIVELSQSEQGVLRAQLERAQAVKSQAITRAERGLSQAMETQKRVTAKTENEILQLFKVNHPDLEKLPFGSTGFGVVLTHVLAMLGFSGTGDEEPAEEDPPKDPPARNPRRSPRSRSSNAS